MERIAEVAKWTTAPVLKTGSANALREFESPPQRNNSIFTFLIFWLKDYQIFEKSF